MCRLFDHAGGDVRGQPGVRVPGCFTDQGIRFPPLAEDDGRESVSPHPSAPVVQDIQ